MDWMKLNPCIGLSFDGQCEAAFHFYERRLNGKIAFMLRWGESPMAKDAPAEWSEKIFHATLVVGDTAFMGADAVPGSYESPRGFSFMLSVDDAGETERVFGALAENGTVSMPLQETFWSPPLAWSPISLASNGTSNMRNPNSVTAASALDALDPDVLQISAASGSNSVRRE